MEKRDKVEFTNDWLKVLKPAAQGQRYVVWDKEQPSFGLRVSDSGHKSFVVMKRPLGSSRVMMVTLTRFNGRNLKNARQLADEALSTLAKGKSPRLEKARKNSDTFSVAVERFIEHERSKGLRSARDTESVLRREFLGQTPKRLRKTTKSETTWQTDWTNSRDAIWRNRSVASIERSDVVERLDSIKARNKFAARHALSAVRKFYNWVVEGSRFGIQHSPAANVRDRLLGLTNRHLRRQRVLDDAELRDVWHAADELGYPFGALVRLLILTGQRRDDIAEAQWQEINDGTLVVPPERLKTAMAHEVPLTSTAETILRSLPRFAKGQFLFSTTDGRRPISGFSKMKARLDRAIENRRMNATAMPPWTLHDLRRTVRTRLTSDCGVDAFIAERVIGHALPGLHAVYDRGKHRDQKRAALEVWASRLRRIVENSNARPHNFKVVA